MELFTDYTLRNVALGTAILGIVSGALGCFALLRRQSLLGDAISHAALPGVVLAFMIVGNKNPLTLITGALIAGWLATILILAIVRNTRIKEDGAIGFGLSVFFGIGLMLLTFVQNNPSDYPGQAGLDTFLFGQAAILIAQDVLVMGIIGGIALIGMMVFWKEFKIVSFDSDFAASLGFPVRVIDVVLTTLLVIAIVIGLEAVGVVLMSAMVVAPAAAARQWTDRLWIMAILAALFGAISGVGGALISSMRFGESNIDLPTGPVIVLLITMIAVASLLFAPNRGVVWDWARRQRNRRRLQSERVLEVLYILEHQHDEQRGHPIETIRPLMMGTRGIRHTLDHLKNKGLVMEIESGYCLTKDGIVAAVETQDFASSSQAETQNLASLHADGGT